MESVEIRIMLAARDGSEVEAKVALIVELRPFYGDGKSVMQFQGGVIDVVHDGLPHVLIVLAKTNLLYPSVYKLNVTSFEPEWGSKIPNIS
jgi:hypothetical protein